jgi:hypothetical protein
MQPATGTAPPALSAADEVAKAWRRAALERGQSRRWAVGDVYAPHDLSPAETKKWRLRTKPERDVFDLLGVDPMDEYKVSEWWGGGGGRGLAGWLAGWMDGWMDGKADVGCACRTTRSCLSS